MNPPDRPQPPVFHRGFLGAIAGWFTALLVAVLWTGPRVPSAVWPVLLFNLLGAAAGATAGIVAGSRELRGKLADTLMGGLFGAAAGCFAGGIAVALAIGNWWDRADLAVVFFVPVALGATLGALIARIRHGGRVTVGEVMAWVAAVALALALAAAARR
jgi:hypothetical protein